MQVPKKLFSSQFNRLACVQLLKAPAGFVPNPVHYFVSRILAAQRLTNHLARIRKKPRCHLVLNELVQSRRKGDRHGVIIMVASHPGKLFGSGSKVLVILRDASGVLVIRSFEQRRCFLCSAHGSCGEHLRRLARFR